MKKNKKKKKNAPTLNETTGSENQEVDQQLDNQQIELSPLQQQQIQSRFDETIFNLETEYEKNRQDAQDQASKYQQELNRLKDLLKAQNEQEEANKNET